MKQVRKGRRTVVLTNVQITFGTGPSDVRELLELVAQAARENADLEEAGSPHQKDQLSIAEVADWAVDRIRAANRENWRQN